MYLSKCFQQKDIIGNERPAIVKSVYIYSVDAAFTLDLFDIDKFTLIKFKWVHKGRKTVYG